MGSTALPALVLIVKKTKKKKNKKNKKKKKTQRNLLKSFAQNSFSSTVVDSSDIVNPMYTVKSPSDLKMIQVKLNKLILVWFHSDTKLCLKSDFIRQTLEFKKIKPNY